MNILLALKVRRLGFKRLSAFIFKIAGLDIPKDVVLGRNVKFPHGGNGVVIHPKTLIGDNVKIYQQVTIGRGDVWRSEGNHFHGFIIQDGAILGAGAKIITVTKLNIGINAVIGANAVVTKNIGDREIWIGNPARKSGLRYD